MSLEYSPNAEQLAEFSGSALPLLVACAALGALLAAGIFVSMRRRQVSLKSDVSVLIELGTKQRGSTASAPVLRNAELTPLADTLQSLVKRLGGQKEKKSGATTKQAKSEDPSDNPIMALIEESSSEFEEDALELELELDEAIEVPQEIFRAYDIRGDADQLSDALIYLVGRALGSTMAEGDQSACIVGADARESSPRIREALVKGLLESGCDVVDIGTVATPMLYFAAQHLQTPNAIMVTGSHHGAGTNGLKMLLGAQPMSDIGIQALRERVEAENFTDGQGSYRVTEINADYVQAIVDDIVISDNPEIVVDCGNGAAAVVAAELFEGLGVSVIPLFGELDGSFPNRESDPSNPENLRPLIAAVKEHNASLGVAFDGDGDRIGVVDDKGRIVQADRLLMLFARDVLSRHPGADIVYDVKCSRHLARIISDAGGRPIMWRSGHSPIKSKMTEVGALLGGEYTGHICFNERWFGFDDALYSAARLLEIIGLEGRSLSDLLTDLPSSVSTPEIRWPLDEAEKLATMSRIIEEAQFDDAKLITIDGLRAEFADGWGLVRCSNTEAALTLRFEADNTEALARIRDLFQVQLSGILDDDALSF